MIASPRLPEPLLALREVSAEWRAGLPPACSIAARLLDRVHLVVCRGDCVVVRHTDPAGARVLLAALQGGPTWERLPGWQGTRLEAAGVRIRRASMRVGVVPAILDGWRHFSVEDEPRPQCPPVVHLLRASREGEVPRHELVAWRRWAHATRREGGAVVVVAPLPDAPRFAPSMATRPSPDPDFHPAPTLLAQRFSPRAGGWPPAHGAATSLLHERPATAGDTGPPPALRTLWLHHGRVHDLHFTIPPPEPNPFGPP